MSNEEPEFVFVPHLPDLIDASEYPDHPDGRLVRIEIRSDGTGVEVLADGFRPAWVEQLLAEVGGGPIDEMLCG
ncbi:radical SAM-modified peptide, FtsH ternary system-associated [Actinoplanes derwentensis]|uniref:Uncharacterized protein n=1 Tax=Actinoplanes derwentensis TaxID=113562 RepID=A0A1H2AIQ5_9ACTN|nr:radical SAM-modified peptide, FtsH ternary system-associated [Actinoplanes derwentensis]GID90307.1 hypothetical protein Ade03nite_92310 [Actinoplanes derwentensis]SDT45652.1 hypothetical protein SAMN04489716_3881 [Actinoplanes derwentensis]